MDVIEAIKTRKSIRAFKPEPVPREVLENIIKAASYAPSWANTQPWEFSVLSTHALDEVRIAVNEKATAGEKPSLDIPPPEFTETYSQRTRALMKQIQSHVEANQAGSNVAPNWWAGVTQWFEAPNGVVLYMDSSLGEWSILDTGMALQNLMLAAWHYGVGTCPMAVAVHYPDILRDLLNIPRSKRIILGVAMGYPDFSSPLATFRSNREPLEEFVRWHGF
ncbi:MAG: nitroreductase [Dehalococcoidia bacterium]